ncbi:MAG: aspartate aminotransferase [Ignavibacteria bacterium CG2_30_36_16]|nr:aminotransferase class I/II-fold pyridoxal phosphate-dependent enzyme [Ignavibacteria bacterium]OIP54748.1 MAG: aspartate aminotransferase [Ignavibacteria bacterium CG2_30_36_16]PJB00871.1 MAG: aspartate aminotransferase [Ignavibacteria bacterium CG_4_9_14_3_um_filter_36_18]
MANHPKKPNVNLNLNVRGLPQSATLAINELSNQLKQEGRKVYKLGLGQSPFPVPESVVDELKVNARQKDYLPVKGLMRLRKAVADYHCRVNGTCHSPEDVLIGPGSKELMFLLQYVYYGDLLIPTPSWVSYAPQAQMIGRQVRWLKTRAENNWILTAEELEARCINDPAKPRILIINYPSNPTGLTYTPGELKELAHVSKKYQVILLSDEIYGELHHKGKHVSIARYYPEGTIISGGLSKWCGAGGWRLGTFTFPASMRWLLDSMAVMASETFTSTSAPIQYAAVRAFSGGHDIEKYLWRCRWILSKLAEVISNKLIAAGISVQFPQGAFYLFPDFSPLREKLVEKGVTGSQSLSRVLLEETGVAILPGEVFGRPPEELTARIAYVDFDGVRAHSAAENLNSQGEIDENFIYNYCGNTIEAIDRICEWVSN